MEEKLLNINLKNYLKEYQIFKQIITEKMLTVKDKNKDKDAPNISIDDKDLSISFIFFSHFKQNFFNENIENIKEKNEKIDYHNIIINFIENSINNYKYNLLYYWLHYIIISFIDEIKSFLNKIEDKREDYTENINKYIYLLNEINSIIAILYNNDKININEIILLLDVYLIWIEDNNYQKNEDKIIYDKYSNIF